MNIPENSVAVLTGDIVNSTKLSPTERETLFAALKAGAEVVGTIQGESPHFDRFSGDSWQMLLTQPKLALRACLLVRAYIRKESKKFETRISVGVGPIEPLSPEGLGASDGIAFQASGRGLKQLRANQFFLINTNDNAAFVLADEISKHWSVKQAAVMLLALGFNPQSHKMIAVDLGVSQQAVSKRLHAAGLPALLAALEELENNNA